MSPQKASASGREAQANTGAAVNDREQFDNTPSAAPGQGASAKGLAGEDLAPYRTQLRRYLTLKGIEILPGDVLRCLQPGNHSNADAHPSAKLYENPQGDQAWCAVCSTSWDIFSVAGLLGAGSRFPDQVRDVKETLGVFTATSGGNGGKTAAAEEWIPIIVDLELCPPPAEHPVLRRPDMAFAYRDGEGRVHGLVYRWEATVDRRKQIRQLTYCRNASGQQAWHWQGMKAPRLPWGTELLSQNPTAPVVLLEGEKKTLIMRRHLESAGAPNVALSLCGGTGGIRKMDLSPLFGREVTLYPDNNQVGRDAMNWIAGLLTKNGCVVRMIEPPAETPEGGDVADLNSATWPPARIRELIESAKEWKAAEVSEQEVTAEPSRELSSEILAKCSGPRWAEAARTFIFEAQHGTAADLLFLALGDGTRAERTSLNGGDTFHHRADGTCFYAPMPTIREVARIVLERAVVDGFAETEKKTSGRDIKDLYERAGKARAKARTRDFVAGALSFFSDRVLVYPAIPWNATPEAIPTQTDVVDFSGDAPIARAPRDDEYFRDPAPCTAEAILTDARPQRFDAFVGSLFADAETKRSAIECFACCIAGKPLKTFQLWNNPEGDGGKNTAFDLVSRLIPGRITMAKNALILYKGDSSERRFGEIELQGRSAVFFDEVGGSFDIAQIKRYTGLSTIRGEAKGHASVEFSQTWALVALCNELPRFFPANDGAFLSRVFVLPFYSVFYADSFDFTRRISAGISLARLKPAVDKETLLTGILEERPAIIGQLIRTWIAMRANGRKPFESAACQRAREIYRQANDLAERFFADYLIRDEYSSVGYAAIKIAWSDFTGEAHPAMREVVAILLKRFPFIEPTQSHGVRKLKGISLKQTDPEDSGNSGTSKLDFDSREQKNEKNIPGTGNAVLGYLSYPSSVPADLSAVQTPDLQRLALELAAYMDGDPPHPELLSEYERLLAAISDRQGATP